MGSKYWNTIVKHWIGSDTGCGKCKVTWLLAP